MKNLGLLRHFVWLAYINFLRLWLTGDASEITVYEDASFLFVEVARDGQNRVIRSVEDAEEFLHICDCRRIEILHRTNRRVGIGGVGKDQFVDSQESVDVGLVVITKTLFLLNCLPLVVEVLLRHLGRAHTIAFRPERERQVVGRQSFLVFVALRRGGPIHRAPALKMCWKCAALGTFSEP